MNQKSTNSFSILAHETMKHEGWRKVMAEEIKALEEQGTWGLEKLPLQKKAFGSE